MAREPEFGLPHALLPRFRVNGVYPLESRRSALGAKLIDSIEDPPLKSLDRWRLIFRPQPCRRCHQSGNNQEFAPVHHEGN
jgi:hypothetical protein